MTLLADIVLMAAAAGAMLYCFILSRRLAKFNDLERGVGGAVAVLSVQVDDMTNTLKKTETAALQSTQSLSGVTDRAEGVAKRLELLVAAMHSLPEGPATKAPAETSPDVEPTKVNGAERQDANTDVKPNEGVLFLRHPVSKQEAAQ